MRIHLSLDWHLVCTQACMRSFLMNIIRTHTENWIIVKALSRTPVRTPGIFIRDTAYLHCDSLNYELQFIEEQRKHAVSRTKMPAVWESTTSLISRRNQGFQLHSMSLCPTGSSDTLA